MQANIYVKVLEFKWIDVSWGSGETLPSWWSKAHGSCMFLYMSMPNMAQQLTHANQKEKPKYDRLLSLGVLSDYLLK
jgi:hypothetical protein